MPLSSTTYTHDGFGRLATSIQTTTGIPYPFTYTYSLTDQLTGVTYPSGQSVSYALDSAGRLAGVSGGALGQST
jgi:YD repeat-containing protein